MAKRRVTIEELEEILNSADNRYRIELLPDGGIEAIDTYAEPKLHDKEIAELKKQLTEKKQEIENLKAISFYEAYKAEIISLRTQLEVAEQKGPVGEWVCPECDFVLHHRVMDTGTGEIGISIVEGIPICMNDCGLMRPLTWEENEERWASGQEVLLLRAEEVEKKLANKCKPIVLGKCEVVIGTASLTGHGGSETTVIIIDGEGRSACIGEPFPDMVGQEYNYDDPRLLAVFDIQHQDGVDVLIHQLELAVSVLPIHTEKEDENDT